MGMCYEYKGDIENAKKCYQKSLELKLRLSKLATESRGEPVAPAQA